MEEPKSYPPYLDYPKPRKQMTNADRIRSMGDDELAAFLCNLRSEKACDGCLNCVAEGFCRSGDTGMIDWIQQPAEGG